VTGQPVRGGDGTNMILGDVGERVTTVEVDDATYEEIIKASSTGSRMCVCVGGGVGGCGCGWVWVPGGAGGGTGSKAECGLGQTKMQAAVAPGQGLLVLGKAYEFVRIHTNSAHIDWSAH
jgi:hypothetical protein